MKVAQRILLLLFVSAGIFGCKSSKKPSLSGEEPVEIADFIDFFPETRLPYTVSDSSLLRKENDSLLIGQKVFTQFVPDSILGSVFSKSKPQLYPMARMKTEETYLFVKAVSGNKRAAFVLSFDKKDKFLAAMPVLQVDQAINTQQTSTIDNRSTITRTVIRRNGNGSISDGKDVYVLNKDAGNFMLIMTDPLDDQPAELVNPIDTFPRKQKFSADYGYGKTSLFSFRDGRRSDRRSFFIHFEKNNGDCTGELKGEAIMRSPTTAIYREPGDPCGLQFTFSAGAVTVKELEGCGSRRGLRCSFDGVYSRKKEVKAKAVKPKNASGK